MPSTSLVPERLRAIVYRALGREADGLLVEEEVN
jgi:hypothetical protein